MLLGGQHDKIPEKREEKVSKCSKMCLNALQVRGDAVLSEVVGGMKPDTQEGSPKDCIFSLIFGGCFHHLGGIHYPVSIFYKRLPGLRRTHAGLVFQ